MDVIRFLPSHLEKKNVNLNENVIQGLKFNQDRYSDSFISKSAVDIKSKPTIVAKQ